MIDLYRKYRLFFILAAIAAVGFLAWYFSSIVVFVIVAAVISMVGEPLVNRLDRLRIGRVAMPHILSVILTMLLILGVFFGMFSLFIPLVVREVNLIGSINWNAFLEHYRGDITGLQQTLVSLGVMHGGASIEASIKDAVLKIIDFGIFSSVMTSIISVTGNFFFNLFSILFLTFFFLKEPKLLPLFILRLTPSANRDQVKNVMYKSQTLIARYFTGLTIQIVLNIVSYTLALWIVGVPNALAIGFFTGVVIIIPYLGGIISMITGVILGVTGVISMGDYAMILPMTIRILAAMFVVQTIDNNLFAPLIQGKSMKAHPVEIFLVVIAAAGIGGIPAMIAAVPVYGFIKIVAGEFMASYRESTRASE